MATRFVGEPIKRREDLNLLTGHAAFIDDIQLPDMLHGAVLRSPHASARIHSIDPEAALALPGVHAVLTAAQLGSANDAMPLLNDDPGFISPRTHRALAIDQVRFVGEAVAFVVRRMEIDFRSPARMDDVLTIVTVPAEVRGARMRLTQTITRDGQVLASAEVTVAVINGFGRARRLPEALMARLAVPGEAGE